jgi:hypothetical protein
MQKLLPRETVSQIPHFFDLTITSLVDENPTPKSEAAPFQCDLVCRLAGRMPKPVAYGGHLAYHFSLVAVGHKLGGKRSPKEVP